MPMVFEHTEPTPTAYRTRKEYRPGDRIPVRCAETTLAVDELLFPAAARKPALTLGMGRIRRARVCVAR
jgi:hypothetical protein